MTTVHHIGGQPRVRGCGLRAARSAVSDGVALVGAAALAGLYLVLAVANPSGMGLGDVKLALPLGLYLGWLGAATWMLGALLGAVFGALAALMLLASRRASWRSRLPYGPFMVMGAFTAIAVTPLLPVLGAAAA